MEHPSMVVLKGKVYIGGGFAKNDVETKTVIVYDPQKDSCTTLPPYAYNYFSMAVVNNQLVLVGGQDSKSFYCTCTNKLGVWGESSTRWTHPFPPMTTPCKRPTIVTHKDRWLIVIGGGIGGSCRLSRVDILDTFSKQWHSSTPMPESLPCSHTLTATIGSTCYLMGGYISTRSSQKRVLSVSLDELVSQARVSKLVSASSPPTPSPWQTLPDTPLKFSTPLALNGTLLAVGGISEFSEERNTIYAYHPERKEWVEAGEMSTERAQCSCIVVPNGEIMVVGTDDLSDLTAQQIHFATVV
jgi:N-acetylneuraminic acid mutarotase